MPRWERAERPSTRASHGASTEASTVRSASNRRAQSGSYGSTLIGTSSILGRHYDHWVSVRELVVLGTASQAPTRTRNHNGYLLRWDGEGILFDPGEGTQRQMIQAGVSATDITRMCITHFHGDHCLGVAGIVQRLSLDRVPHPVPAHYPASGAEYFGRLRHASVFHETADVREEPVEADGVIATGAFGTLSATRLDHPVDTFGY